MLSAKNRKGALGLLGITLFLIAISLLGCGGGSSGDGNGGGDNDPDPLTPAADLSGTWIEQETITGNCEGDIYPITKTDLVTITQSGSKLTVKFGSTGSQITGTINGSEVVFKGKIKSDDGTSSIDFSGTVAVDDDSVDGSTDWTWTDGSYTCSGTTEILLTRQGTATRDATGTWTGTWQSTTHSGIEGSFTAQIEQSDGQLSGLIDIPYLGMQGADLIGSVDGDQITFGDIDGTITFTGTLGQQDHASGSYVVPSMSDVGTWSADR
jgi:hypothetical protein